MRINSNRIANKRALSLMYSVIYLIGQIIWQRQPPDFWVVAIK